MMAFTELGHSEPYCGTIDSIIHVPNDLNEIVCSRTKCVQYTLQVTNIQFCCLII